MERLICLLIGYGIGCVQTAFIVGKTMGNIDIRQYGSGNAGTTNVARVLGFKAGITVFICDVLKGLIAFVLCSLIFGGQCTFFDGNGLIYGMYGGLGAVLGHDFPFYLKFKGGKGIATTGGIILAIHPQVALITYLVTAIIMFSTKLISLGSIIAMVLVTVLMFVYDFANEEILIMTIIAILAIYQHIPNIKRLIKGEEKKFTIKKNK